MLEIRETNATTRDIGVRGDATISIASQETGVVVFSTTAVAELVVWGDWTHQQVGRRAR